MIQKVQDKKSVLKWNFPTMGKLFLDILNDFVKKSTKEVLKSLCEKEHSFAGYWFEGIFYEHHKQLPSSLFVEYLLVGAHSLQASQKHLL